MRKLASGHSAAPCSPLVIPTPPWHFHLALRCTLDFSSAIPRANPPMPPFASIGAPPAPPALRLGLYCTSIPTRLALLMSPPSKVQAPFQRKQTGPLSPSLPMGCRVKSLPWPLATTTPFVMARKPPSPTNCPLGGKAASGSTTPTMIPSSLEGTAAPSQPGWPSPSSIIKGPSVTISSRPSNPDEQMWIDVGKLIREHVPDRNGKTLPADLTSGSYEFRDLTNIGVGTLFEGKVIYDKTYGHVAYGCGTCCGYYQPKFFYDPLLVPVGSTGGNGVTALDQCTQKYDDVSTEFYGNWSSANTAIVTVDYYGTHSAVSVGSTTSSTSGWLTHYGHTLCPDWNPRPSGGDNVNPPDHLKILSDSLQAISSCPATVRRLIKYQEVSVNNAPVGTVQSKEQFGSKSANTCNNGNLGTSETCSADAGGVFTDILFVGCNSVGGSCGVTFTKQQWLWCPPNGAAVVIATPGDLIIHNNEVSVGGNTAGFATGTCIYASGMVSNPCI